MSTIVFKMSTCESLILDTLFSSGTRVGLLTILLLEPQGKFYLRELAARSGLPVGNVRRELSALVAAGIVTKDVRGKQAYYSINERCPVIPELRSMFAKTTGPAGIIKSSLESLSDHIRMAFIYGSVAKGRLTEDSDVDLMIVGEISFKEAVNALRQAQDQLGREINPTVYPVKEFAGKVRNKDRFITSVLNEPKVYIIGDEDELRRLA